MSVLFQGSGVGVTDFLLRYLQGVDGCRNGKVESVQAPWQVGLQDNGLGTSFITVEGLDTNGAHGDGQWGLRSCGKMGQALKVLR